MHRMFVTLLLLCSAACNPANATADLAASEKAIAAFHADANAAKFDDIYFASSDEMQNAQDVADFETFLGAVHRKLGKAGKSTQEGWRINYMNGTSMTILNMKTIYEKGEAEEIFTFKSSPNGPLLVGYNIQSKELIIN